MEQDLQGCRMAFSPEQAPARGGGTIVVAFSDDTHFPPDAELFLVYEGEYQRHITEARQVNEQTLHSSIPAHDSAEAVQLSVYLDQENNSEFRHLASRRFQYYFDSAHHLTLFLLQSIYNSHALDDLELVRSEYFDLCNEVLSTLDDRVSRTLQHLSIPDNWNLTGMDTKNNDGEPQEPRDNLFHFSARLGLDKVATFFLDQPGCEEALRLPNRHGYLPRDIALENNNHGLAELLSDYNTHRSVSSPDQPATVCEDGLYYRSDLGTATLTTTADKNHRTVEQDILSLKTVRHRIQASDQRDLNRLHQRQFETDWPKKSPSTSGESLGRIIDLSAPWEKITDSVVEVVEEITDPVVEEITDSVVEEITDSVVEEITDAVVEEITDPVVEEITDPVVEQITDLVEQITDKIEPITCTDSVSVGKKQASFESKEKESDFQPVFSDNSESFPLIANGFTEEVDEEDLSPTGDEELSEFTERLHISDEDVEIDEEDIFIEEDHSYSAPSYQSPSRSPLSPQPPRMVEIPEETVSMPISTGQNTTSILEESLRQLRGIHTGLQRIRSNRLHLTVQELRRENLQRFSSSCPSLDDQGRNSPLSPVHEEDYHKSMLDLIQEGEPPTALLPDDDDYALSRASDHDATGSTQYERNPEREGVGTYESDVRIVINDVTEDSTEDGNVFDGTVSDEDYEQETTLTRLVPTRKSCRRRRSWCPDVKMRNVANDQRRDFKAEMLKSNGRSLSLSSLENDLVSEEDDSFHDAKENQTPSQSQMSLSNGRVVKPVDVQVSHREPSPTKIGTNRNSSPACFKEFESGVPPWEIQGRSERALSTSASLETTPTETSGKEFSNSVVKQRAQTSIATPHGGSLDCDQRHSNVSSSLVVPHSSLMQKSRSTPSLPEATDSLKPKQDVEMRKDSPKRKARDKKQDHGDVLASHIVLRNAIADYDAQFRRQEEVEEDEDETLNQFLKNEDHKKSQISLTDFLADSTAVYDSDDKGKSKEEKRRRTSVFSKLTRGSNRGRKSKDKENKQKSQTHQFVSVSFSNSTLCYVCGRTLANKPALRCESCMINVHENSCKEQIPPCLKFKQQQKVPQRDGQGQVPPGNAPKEKQSIFSQASSGLKYVPSFKNRSASTPTRSQPQQSSVAGLPRSNTSPSSKVINEEGENDVSRQDPESNMADTISVSMESLDEGATEVTDLEEEELSLTEQEPEAWSVTIDKKVLKKMHAKDVKRQDTIWELIQTELHYCRSLKILQKIFSRGMLSELHMSQETVDKLFPNLDDLIDMHMTFLRNLRQLQARQNDKFIEEIGPSLVQQFSGEMGSRMKAAYGEFCSQKEKAVQMYKDFLKDKKFFTFIKRCNMNILCRRQEIPGFLLLISLRITKYPILIESILKTTKKKKVPTATLR